MAERQWSRSPKGGSLFFFHSSHAGHVLGQDECVHPRPSAAKLARNAAGKAYGSDAGGGAAKDTVSAYVPQCDGTGAMH